MSASSAKPVYVSSSGTLTSQPFMNKVRNLAFNYWMLVYLFFETLFLPMINPASWVNPSVRPVPRSNKGTGVGGGSSGGYPGGGGGRGGGRGRGNGGGFMSMTDLQGGGTVDSGRATCG